MPLATLVAVRIAVSPDSYLWALTGLSSLLGYTGLTHCLMRFSCLAAGIDEIMTI